MISAEPSNQIKKIVVLGGGTAGFLTALAVKKHLPHLDVTIVRSTKMGVIGVGEGTIPSVVHFLHRFLGFEATALYREVGASPKLGIRYLWGKRPFFNYTFTGQLIQGHPTLSMPRGYYCKDSFEFADVNSALMTFEKCCVRGPNGAPRLNNSSAYHLENRKFVSFLEKQADKLAINKIDNVVEATTSSENGVEKLILEGGQQVQADLFIDASGFRAELIGKALDEPVADYRNALFCDRAVVGGWKRTDETYHPYTTAETMDAGWCWRIEHDDLINRGYVFCSRFISDEQAVEEYQKKNPKAEVAKVIPFPAGVRNRTWVKNVIAVGNSAGFVEPLEATAIGMICDAALRLVKSLQASGCRNLPVQRRIYNRITRTNWDIIRDFLALHYKFNTRLDTEFWKVAREDVDIGNAQEFVDYYREVGPDFTILGTELKRDFFTAEGYLVMLLGQAVPFARPVNISPEQDAAWKKFKDGLKIRAQAGLNVPEFLKLVRSEQGARELNQQTAQANEMRRVRHGESPKIGELNWH